MRLLRRPIAFLLLVWFLPACSTYRTTDLTPQEAVAGQKIVRVVATPEDEAIELNAPWVRADSIGGITSTGSDWSAPLSSVNEVKIKRFNPWLTSGVVVGGLVVGAAVTLVIICGLGDSWQCFEG
jgi:hypothetical protein